MTHPMEALALLEASPDDDFLDLPYPPPQFDPPHAEGLSSVVGAGSSDLVPAAGSPRPAMGRDLDPSGLEEAPELMESPKKRKATFGVRLRERLTRRNAFFTSEGVLGTEVMGMVNSIFHAVRGFRPLPGIAAEMRRPGESTTSTLESKCYMLENLEAMPFGNICKPDKALGMHAVSSKTPRAKKKALSVAAKKGADLIPQSKTIFLPLMLLSKPNRRHHMVCIKLSRLMACLIICIKRFIERAHCFILTITCKFKQALEKKPTQHRARQLVLKDPKIWGMDTYKNRAHDFLESERPCDSVLGFWGPAGVGKHTLLKCIYFSYFYVGYAPFCHAMVIGNQACTVKELQDWVAFFSGLDRGAMSLLDEQSRAKLISDHLKGKPFLVMLHNVQDFIDLAAIGLPLGGRLQKVIFTTSSKDVCALMVDADNVVEIQRLGEDDAWGLFTQYGVKEMINANPDLHDMAIELAAACGGLPRALRRVGAHMGSMNDPREWRCFYDCFKAKKMPGILRRLNVFLGLQ